MIRCDYCGEPAALITGRELYPHRPDLTHVRAWKCAPCDAWVGCHRGTTRPLGRLANADLRAAKQAAHAAFDPLWRGTKWRRSAAYRWLAQQMGLPAKQCHIGMFDANQCARVVAIVEAAK